MAKLSLYGIASLVYVFLSAIILSRIDLSGIWAVFSGGLMLAPVTFFMGWEKLKWPLALVWYVILAVEILVVSTAITPGESFYSGSTEHAWYTPLLFVATFAPMVALVNALPSIVFYGLGRFASGKRTRMA